MNDDGIELSSYFLIQRWWTERELFTSYTTVYIFLHPFPIGMFLFRYRKSTSKKRLNIEFDSSKLVLELWQKKSKKTKVKQIQFPFHTHFRTKPFGFVQQTSFSSSFHTLCTQCFFVHWFHFNFFHSWYFLPVLRKVLEHLYVRRGSSKRMESENIGSSKLKL